MKKLIIVLLSLALIMLTACTYNEQQEAIPTAKETAPSAPTEVVAEEPPAEKEDAAAEVDAEAEVPVDVSDKDTATGPAKDAEADK